MRIGSYLYTKGVKWPVAPDSKLTISLFGEKLKFASTKERKALYYLTQVCGMLASGHNDLDHDPDSFINLIDEAEGFTSKNADGEDERWNGKRIQNYNLRQIEGITAVREHLTSS